MTRQSWIPAIVGLLALVPLIIASHVAAGVAFAVYDHLPDSTQRSVWLRYMLNDVAPAVGGIVCGLGVVALLTRRQQFNPTWQGHIQRALTWYLGASWVQWIAFQNTGNTDFGLWSQTITWPQAAFLGAAATDAALSIWRGWHRRSNDALHLASDADDGAR
jgi:hypothetical protein